MKRFCPKLSNRRMEGDDTQEANPIPARIEMRDTRIDLFFTNNRSVWIEQEDGAINTRCTGPNDDEPTSVAMTDTDLTINTPKIEIARTWGSPHTPKALSRPARKPL